MARFDEGAVASAAEDLWRHRGASLVVSGSQDTATQIVVHAINALLGNIGTTVDIESPSLQKQGDDRSLAQLVDEMERGEIHGLLLYGVNPAYDFPDAARFARGLASVALTISFADRLDETASLAHAVCPDHHFLEAWNDAEAVTGSFSLAQPTIAPLLDTRAAQDSLLTWLGKEPDFYAYVREFWRSHIYPTDARGRTFDELWDHALHDGVYHRNVPAATTPFRPSGPFTAAWQSAAHEVGGRRRSFAAPAADRYELHLYETVAIRDGRHANNPWLQELPDPVTKVTWGNYLVLAPSLARRLGLESGDVVRDGDPGRCSSSCPPTSSRDSRRARSPSRSATGGSTRGKSPTASARTPFRSSRASTVSASTTAAAWFSRKQVDRSRSPPRRRIIR